MVLVEPEIPQNAGNVGALCAATGAALHWCGRWALCFRTGIFKRAGDDYFSTASIAVHDDWAGPLAAVGEEPFFLTTGLALDPPARELWQLRFQTCAAAFWQGIRGFAAGTAGQIPELTVRIPMPEGTRGLNLATAAGIVLYEAPRQSGRGLMAGETWHWRLADARPLARTAKCIGGTPMPRGSGIFDRGETAAEGVFRDGTRIGELQKIIRAAGLGAHAGEAESAKGLPADEGAGDRAVEVEVADAEFLLGAGEVEGVRE